MINELFLNFFFLLSSTFLMKQFWFVFSIIVFSNFFCGMEFFLDEIFLDFSWTFLMNNFFLVSLFSWTFLEVQFFNFCFFYLIFSMKFKLIFDGLFWTFLRFFWNFFSMYLVIYLKISGHSLPRAGAKDD